MTREPPVLVVDDDALMRAALRRVIAAAHIPVETYASASDLLTEADLRQPAVLLLDVMMPGMSGIQLQAQLSERGIGLPIIFLTGSADVPMAVAAMRNGAVDFLEKPFDNVDLVARLRRALARGSVAPTRQARTVDPDHARRMATLTPREREVFNHMITGKTSKMIARDVGGSFRTVEIHRARVMSKMDAGSLADLVRIAFEIDVVV